VAVLIGLCAAPATAADQVSVVNTETVQVYTDATGRVQEQRVYEQLSFTGSGPVTVANPVSTDGLRNLDDFGGFEVEGGNQIVELEVNGDRRLRSVSDFDEQQLPLTVSAEYRLDGELVEPGDVVGESGVLEVRYRVENVTGQPQQIAYDDGSGNTLTKEVDVVIPMVGSLTTTLPSSFTHVRSDEANKAGDGRGGTRLTFTMTLFEPIGSAVAEFGYTADITDGVVPDASMSALPVNPLESPSYKGGAESYKGGADTGAELTAGGAEIDANLLKLRDGAGDLLAGLIRLHAGADRLSAGLNGEAGPGSVRLADGAGELADGLGRLEDGGALLAQKMGAAETGSVRLADGSRQLASGLDELKSGGGRLAEGAGTASDGADRLAGGARLLADGLHEAEAKAPALVDGLQQVKGGLQQVDDGLAQMYGGIGNLPAKAQPLHDGIQQLVGGIGTTGDGGTLLYGVDQVRSKLDSALPQVGRLVVGADCMDVVLGHVLNGTTAAAPSACYPSGRPNLPALPEPSGPDGAPTSPDELRHALLTALRTNAAVPVHQGLVQLEGDLSDPDPTKGAIAALTRIECGLSNASLPGECAADVPGLLEGVNALGLGVSELVDGVVAQVQGGVGTSQDEPVDQTLRGGVNGLQDGVDQIAAGGATLLAGLAELSEGADRVAGGSDDLSGGLDELAAGAELLDAGAADASSGADRLAAGNGELRDGLALLRDGAGGLAEGAAEAEAGGDQVADGAQQLADGLGDAASGSSRLADGMEEAATGAPKLVDGAQRLSDEGTQKLIEAGASTAQTFGESYAVIEAGAERARAEGMAFGAPEGAAGATAFTYELRGDTGEGGRNLTRGIAALALLAAGAGVLLLRRGSV